VLQRDLDIRGQLETLTSRLSGKIRNVTCVMQELGYVSGVSSLSIRGRGVVSGEVGRMWEYSDCMRSMDLP
jgi:hypothetical protein